MNRIFSLMAVVLILLLNAAPATSGSFFEGKKVRLIVSSTPGGGNDTYSRLIARHISKHIPGKPTMIVQNMPGAGGLLAADYLYRKAKRDGTVMEQINWGVWNYQVIKDPRARFDFNKMNALGVAAIENSIIYSRKDRFKSLDDIRRSGKLAKVGVSGRQSTGHVIGNIVERIVGAKLFEYVFGYPGARQYSLAVRQGEVDVSGNTKSSFLDQLGDMWKAGELVMLAQAGEVDGKKAKIFPKAPLLKELAKTPEAKKMVEATFLLSHYGRPFSLPPGVPQDRVKLLRDAFWKTMKDPKFLKEAKRLRRPIVPTHGEKLQEMWKGALDAPPEQVEIVRTIFGGKKKKK